MNRFGHLDGASTTALVLFGGVLLFIAITRRVPLLLKVRTAKIDTSYEATDEAFEAARESATEELVSHPTKPSDQPVDYRRVLGNLFRRPVAARAGITYRQLDYWARTKLIVPSAVALPRRKRARLACILRRTSSC